MTSLHLQTRLHATAHLVKMAALAIHRLARTRALVLSAGQESTASKARDFTGQLNFCTLIYHFKFINLFDIVRCCVGVILSCA